MKTVPGLHELSQPEPWNRLIHHRGKTVCTQKGRCTSPPLKPPPLLQRACSLSRVGLTTLVERLGICQWRWWGWWWFTSTCYLYFFRSALLGRAKLSLYYAEQGGTITVFLPTRCLAQSLIFPALIAVTSSLMHNRLHRGLGKDLWAVRAYGLRLLQPLLGYTSDPDTATVTVED